MKGYPYTRTSARHLLSLALIASLTLPLPAVAASVILATSPLTSSTTSSVSPNLMFILDDSGSMGWNYMPDNANDFDGAYGFASNQCNGVYYDPTITYTPPVNSNGTSYADASFTAAWNDGYNTGGGTTNLDTSFQPTSSYKVGKAFYYAYSGTQTSADKKDYYNTNSIFYKECNSSIGSTTMVDGVNPVNTLFTRRTLATTETVPITITSGGSATITVTSASSARGTSIIVSGTGGGEIMSGQSSSSSNTSTLANNIATKINACTSAITGNCTVSGYSATTSGNVVTITGPAAGGATLTLSTSGTMTFTATTFPTPLATAVSSIKVNGVELLLSGTTATSASATTLATSVAAGINATGYSATASGNIVIITGPVSAANYTPVITTVPASGGMTLSPGTFPETDPVKLKNFANWHSYYHTRMLMMKTASGLAFKAIDNKYRVGLMTINNNVNPDAVDLAPFWNNSDTALGPVSTHKADWYAKLYASTPNNSTPLREALAKAGLYYAHKLPSNTLNGLAVRDPVQYSCQQNFTILSTDGFWNGNDGFKLDGSTAVGNQDGVAPRPLYDGGQINKVTSQVRQTQTQLTKSTSRIESRTQQIQSQTGPLQSSTSTLQKQTSQLQKQTSTLQRQTGALQKSTTANGNDAIPTWTAWSPVASCTWDKSGSTRAKCQYDTLTTPPVNAASSCTLVDQSANTSNGTTWSGDKVVCQYSAYGGTTNVGSCTTVAQSGSSPYTVLTAVQCATAVSSPYANVSSCTVTTPDAGGASTQCQYTAYSTPANVGSCTTVAKDTTNPYDMTASGGTATSCAYTYTAWANASSCTAVAPSAGSPYTVGTATNCQTTDTGWVGTNSCTPSVSGGQTVTCQTFTTGPTPVASCTPVTATAGNSWTSTSCTTATIMSATLVASCTASSPTAANSYVNTTCNPSVTTINNAASCTPQTASNSNSWTTVTCSSTGGTFDTLADVAMYYYETDLRTPTLNNCTGALGSTGAGAGITVCDNNVFVSGTDNNVQQHMTTFTLGLGARGRMVYSSDYLSQTSGDYYSILKGSATDLTATPPVCSWQATGTACNWPVPASNAIENIDDLWHAAVDGRGTYFSATDPASLATGLSKALSSITARKGAAAAAATSTLNPVPGNNLAYLASYTTVKWTGNLEARSINVITSEISASATWCAENTIGGTCSSPGSIVTDSSGSSSVYYCVTPGATVTSCSSPGVFDSAASTCSVQMPVACTGSLPPRVASTSDTRTIYTPNSGGTALVDFIYTNLNTTDFDAARIGSLSQWSTLTATQKTAAEGANLVNYLRGQTGYDDRAGNLVGTVDNRLYRHRETVLGDVLESQPFFMAGPVFSYTDAGYAAFKTDKAARVGTVYVGANDGMLHAFAAKDDASTSPPEVGGKERWAYVPSMVISNMWKLADKNYDILHANFINGSVNIADIYCTANCGGPGGSPQWRTILVGGLNSGGRGYYALDINDPAAPKLMWEFTTADDPNVGYSFGNPAITKMADGTWVVLVTSGYNNGDGKGYLYVLNATTGAIIKTISSGVGSTTTPSGLAKIAVWNDVPASNQAGYTYAGDLLGNVWRFDINAAPVAGVNPLKFATLFSDAAGTQPQPITTSPVLGQIAGKRVVFVGTGKYLETSDLTNTQVQTQYAIKDDNATTTLVNPRNTLVRQTLTNDPTATTSRTGSSNAVNFKTGPGWFADFPDSGERVNIDSSLIMGTLLVPTIVPSSTVCSPGGYSWFNYFNYETGGLVTPSEQSNSPIVGFNVIYIEGVAYLKIVYADGTIGDPKKPVFKTGLASGFTGKRMIWRELIPQ